MFLMAGFGLGDEVVSTLMVSGLCKWGHCYIKGLLEVTVRHTGITEDHSLIWQRSQMAAGSLKYIQRFGR